MKNKYLFVLMFLFLIFSMSSLFALNNTFNQGDVNRAYSCLTDEINEKGCENLGLGEQIFSVLSTGKCKTELLEASSNEECWPSGNCDIKSTSQAMLALEEKGTVSDEAKDWLLESTVPPREIDWFLQIESNYETSCTINYETNSNDRTTNVVFAEDKKITSISGGSCFSATNTGDYWLEVSESCYGTEFQISCDQDFLTSLLFQGSSSSTIHVLDSASSASAGGTTAETVESSCFSLSSNSCDYEASLWATLTLDFLDEEVKEYMPYLISLADETVNEKYLPHSFLYYLTGESNYRSKVLGQQISEKYWLESQDKFYDTALALYPFQSETLTEKTNSLNWLLSEEVQGEDGCWDNKNIKNTGFLLYSLWPEESSGGSTSCEGANFYCMSGGDCSDSGGDVLDSYSCPGITKCCSVDQIQETCEEQGGDICSSNEQCSGYGDSSASDTKSGEVCCTGGSCLPIQEQTACESQGGTCRTSGCGSTEDIIFSSCSNLQEECCVPETTKEKSYTWLWILFILIILTVVAIFYKDKLRVMMLRFKGKKGPGRGGPQRGGPRPPRGMPPEAPSMRQFQPRRSHAPARRRPQGEIDHVLKKLKDMGR